jgi:hypothetical protein
MFVFFVTDENEIVSDVESDDNEDQCEWKLIDDDGNVEQPKKSMTFDSIEELKSYYRRFGKQMGFGVVQKKVTRDKISRKEVGLYYLKSCSQLQRYLKIKKKKKIIMRFKSWLVLSKILLTILQDIWPRELLEG